MAVATTIIDKGWLWRQKREDELDVCVDSASLEATLTTETRGPVQGEPNSMVIDDLHVGGSD